MMILDRRFQSSHAPDHVGRGEAGYVFRENWIRGCVRGDNFRGRCAQENCDWSLQSAVDFSSPYNNVIDGPYFNGNRKPRGTLMFGPVIPASRPRNQSSELRQYAADEWGSNHYRLVLEAERLADEKRMDADLREAERTSSLWKHWTSGLKRVTRMLERK
jgi:hypothetical protein